MSGLVRTGYSKVEIKDNMMEVGLIHDVLNVLCHVLHDVLPLCSYMGFLMFGNKNVICNITSVLQPSYMFLDKEHRGPIITEESDILPMGPTTTEDVLPSQLVDANDNDLLLSASDREESLVTNGNGSLAYSGPDLSGFETSSFAPRSALSLSVHSGLKKSLKSI